MKVMVPYHLRSDAGHMLRSGVGSPLFILAPLELAQRVWSFSSEIQATQLGPG